MVMNLLFALVRSANRRDLLSYLAGQSARETCIARLDFAKPSIDLEA
jgi:hypothetical protein